MLDDPAVRKRLRDLPPSAKLTAHVLADDAPLSQPEVADRTLLPNRTARWALSRLEAVGLARGRPDARDGRQQRYVLTPDASRAVRSDDRDLD